MLVEFGIQLKESRIPPTIAIQNPSSTDQDCLESNAWNPEYAAWNPESKTALDSLAWAIQLYLPGVKAFFVFSPSFKI